MERKRARPGHWRRILRDRRRARRNSLKGYTRLELNGSARTSLNFGFDPGTSVEFSPERILFPTSLYFDQVVTLFNRWTEQNSWKTRGAAERKQLLFTLVANLLVLPRTSRSDLLRAPLSIRVTASPYLQQAIRFLRTQKFVNFLPGYSHRSSRSDTSKIYPTSEFDRLFPPLGEFETNLHVTFPDSELVRMKRDEKRVPLSATNRRRTAPIAKKLEHINRVNLQHHIVIRSKDREYPCCTKLYMVFNRNLERGGRIYASGNSYQNDLKYLRPHIYIDDEPTVELDYSGLHPRMLYAMEGIQYDGDLYKLGEALPEYTGDSDLRSLSKLALLMLINASDETNLAGALAYIVRTEHRRLFRRLNRKYPTSNDQKGIFSRVVEAIKSKHVPIARYLHSDYGIKLQRLDGQMALDICYSFTQQDIPILPVHDSFIVAHQHADLLRTLMDETYREYNRGFTCPIE